MNAPAKIREAPGETLASATIAKSDLTRAAKLAAATAARRTTVPVLEYAHVRIGAGQVRIAATNLDMEAVTTVEAETTGGTDVMIRARTLAAFAADAEGPVNIAVSDEVGDRRITLSDGVTTLRLRGHMHPDDYPRVTDGWRGTDKEPAAALEASPAALRRLFALAWPCISTEETRYYLNGVHLSQHPERGTLRAQATDGHRLARIDSDVPAPGLPDSGVIVPTFAVKALLSLIGRGDGNEPWRIEVTQRGMVATCGDVVLFSKMIDGAFPDVSRVIPEPSENLVAHLSLGLLRRLARIQKAWNGHSRSAVKINLAEGCIESRSVELDVIRHPVSGRCAEGHDHVGFNLEYLHDLARLLPAFTIRAEDMHSPARVEGDDPDALWIVMPMRV